MLGVYLSSTATEAAEVIVAAGLVLLAMGVAVAIPFVFQFFIDDPRETQD
jgi:hypothetical protein